MLVSENITKADIVVILLGMCCKKFMQICRMSAIRLIKFRTCFSVIKNLKKGVKFENSYKI